MEILIYQIIIAASIIVVGLFGTKARNYVAIFFGIFTIVQIFTMWLAILQFFTIVIAYVISDSIEEKSQEIQRIKKQQKKYNQPTETNYSFYFIIFLIISSIFYAISVFNKKAEVESIDIKPTEIETQYQIPVNSRSNNSNVEENLESVNEDEAVEENSNVDSDENVSSKNDSYEYNDEKDDPLNENIQ